MIKPLPTLALLGILLATPRLPAQHGHLNAGALGTAQNDKLYFANGADFAASSGYVKDLNYASTGKYAGLYEGGITLTALPQTIANGGPVPNAPALGSFIQVRMELTSAPPNSKFSFWESEAAGPTLTLSAGSPGPSGLWALSDASLGAGQPGADPFGHLHGRRFTADTPGDYTVSFRVFDTSVNGADEGRIHLPSDALEIRFRAIPEPSTLALLGAGTGILGIWAWRRKSTANDAREEQ